MQKRPASPYFDFTRKERNATIFLVSLILLVTVLPFFYSLLFPAREHVLVQQQWNLQPETNMDGKLYRPETPASKFHTFEKKDNKTDNKIELFYFDPNSLPADQWKRLGVKEKTIATIQHYLEKGGRFRQPADIANIWGLHAEQVQQLIAFVRIKEEKVPDAKSAGVAPSFRKQSPVMIDINEADTAAWIALPGIGSRLSARIISFRDKLGGFYSIDQVGEIYGLADSVFQKIRPLLKLSGSVQQININTATAEEMKQHPYIRYELANLLVQYRTQHGAFSSVADIKKIMTVSDELYNRLSGYLTVK